MPRVVDSKRGLSTIEVQAVDRGCGLSTVEAIFCFAFLHQSLPLQKSSYSNLYIIARWGLFSWNSLLLKYTIIPSFSKNFSRLFLSAAALYFLLHFSTKSALFYMRGSPNIKFMLNSSQLSLRTHNRFSLKIKLSII